MFHYKKNKKTKQNNNKKTKKNPKTTKTKNLNNLNPACASDIYLLKYSHFRRQTWIW